MKQTNTSELLEPAAQTGKKINLARRIQRSISKSPYTYLFYCFLVPAVISYLVYLAMEIHPFGDSSVLVLDLNAQYVYFFEALRDFVHGDANLLYSFSRALGGEFVGIYAYYIASPLSYIVALFPKDRMLEALLTMFLIKTGLCGATFGFYIHKHSKTQNKVLIVMFSAMYALCSYGVVHQNNTMWIDALIWLPLLTYGIEQLVKFGKYKLFVVSLALTVWSNYYIGYMVCIYVAAYFFFYMLAFKGSANNPRNERAHFSRSFIRIALFSALGVAIAAFVILGAYYSLSFGKNTFSSPNFTPKAKFEVLDFLTKFLPGAYDTVRPEGLPFVYTGLLTVILVPIFFLSKKFTSREKIASIAFIGFFAISFIVSTLDLVWHGFQVPNWLNYRYSFILCFFLLTLAYKGMSALKGMSEKVILGICAFVILFVAVSQKQTLETYLKSDSSLLEMQTVWLAIIATVFFLVMLCLLKKEKHPRKRENLCALLAIVVCIELFCNALTMFVELDKDVVFSDYSPYNNYLDGMREAVDIVESNDPSFYRMEMTEHRQINDSFALSTNGLSGSTSTLNKETIAFLRKMGYASQSHWSTYKGGNPVNDSLIGIKYIVDSKVSKTSPLYYEAPYSSTKYTIYRNQYALSLAYGVDSSISEFDMSAYDSHFERLNALVGTMLGDGGSADIFVPVVTDVMSHTACEKSYIENHHWFKKNSDSPATVTICATTTQDGELFFYAPSRYTRPVKLTVNGTSQGTYFDGESDRIISLGVYKAGQVVTVKLTMDTSNDLYLLDGYDYFYHIDTEKLEECFTALAQKPQYKIDDGCPDNHLTGTITTEDETQTILTTIPFDKGWKIYVDGEAVETYESLDALVTFDIEGSGEHTLEMKYAPTAHTLGMLISVTAIGIFIVICIGESVIKRIIKKKGLQSEYVPDVLWELEDFEEDERLLSSLSPEEANKKMSLKKLVSSFGAALSRAHKNQDKQEDTEKDTNDDTNGGN